MIVFPVSFIKESSTLNQGLIIHLDANNSLSYPGTGTDVFDLVNSYDHTLTGATYTVLDGIKCFDCTAGTMRVVVNGTGPTLPTTGYTYITWARLEPISPAGFRTLLYTNSPKYTPITIPDNSNTLGYWDSAFRSSGYDLSAQNDMWVQYAVVGDSSSQTFYINGSQVGSTINYGAGGRTHWGWGNNDVAAQPWGYVANMYLYDRKLSQSEINQQYNLLSPTFNKYVTSNLVMYLDPNNPSSYSGSGTTVDDLSGNSLDATLNNNTYTAPAFNFNGTSSVITVPDNPLLEPGSGDWSIEVWVNHSVITGSSRAIMTKTNGGLASEWGYGIRTSQTGATYMEVGNGSTSTTSPSSTLSTNTWYQIVGVFTNVASNSIALYVNGSLIGSNSHSFSSIRDTSGVLSLGSFNNNVGGFGQWFNGKMGIVRIYNKALSNAEVVQNLQADASKYGITYDAIRAQLTTAQQATYDAAAVGSWIKVTVTQYTNIVNNVTGATKKGNSDVQVNTRDSITGISSRPVAFGAGSTPSFQINSGEYVIAMITEAWNQNTGQSQLGYTTSFLGNTITNIGPTAGPSTGGGRDYYIRKAPTDIATETRYPTLSMTVSPNAVAAWSGFNTLNSGATWTANGANQTPKIQLVTTSTKSW